MNGFLEWWRVHGSDFPGYNDLRVAKYVWDAATATERERCAKLVEDYQGEPEAMAHLAKRIRKGRS
jgi:hypothetical protein